jgi:hypothetical protein
MRILNSDQNSNGFVCETRPEHVYVGIKGNEMDRTLALEYLNNAVIQCIRARTENLLIERESPTKEDCEAFLEAFRFFLGICRCFKIALVNQGLSVDEMKQYGFRVPEGHRAEYRFFTNVENAEKWLLEVDAPHYSLSELMNELAA